MKCFGYGFLFVLTALPATGCYRSQRLDGDSLSAALDTETTIDVSSEMPDTDAPDTGFETDGDTDSDRDSDACGPVEYSLSVDGDPACVLEQVDFADDGSVDQVFLEVVDTSSGALLYADRDENGDGDLEHRTVFSYDAAGRLQSEGADMYGDGSFESLIRYRYDGTGRLLEQERDANLDCSVEQRTAYRYVGAGVSLQTVTVYRADGTVLRIDTYTYDGAGRLIRTERDQNGDGSISARTHYTYDENGNLATLVQDSGSDDAVFKRQVFSYNAAGLLLRTLQDTGDGVSDLSILYTYDRYDRPATVDRWDETGLSERIAYTYESGTDRPVLEETMRGEDLSVEKARRFIYACPWGP